MKRKTRRKLLIISFAALMFLALWSLVAGLLGLPVGRSLAGAFLVGFGYGLYEEFYVQGRAGAWLRRRSALFEIFLNIAVLVVLLLVVMNFNRLLQMYVLNAVWPTGMEEAQSHRAYQRLPIVLPVLIGFSALLVALLRVINFVGGRNLLYLMIGRYRRPVLERRMFLFLDMKDSTSLAEDLGPLTTRDLIGKLFFDVSRPIYDHGGEIYRFTGDGLVVTWRIGETETLDFLIETIDAVVASVSAETDHYRGRYGHVPGFRIGVHCGDVVVCEEGDMKRAIGYYGDTIHIAARLEQEAKSRGCDCLVSAAVAARVVRHAHRLRRLERAAVRGIREPVEVFELRFDTVPENVQERPTDSAGRAP